MPKRDNEVQPTPIERSLAAELSRPTVTSPDAQSRDALPVIPRPDRERKASFTCEALDEIDEAVALLATSVGLRQLHWTSANRALWSCLVRSLVECEGLQLHAPPLRQPASGDVLETTRMERELAEYLWTLLRSPAAERALASGDEATPHAPDQPHD